MNDPKTPAPNSQHPQAKALGKNKFNKAAAEKHPLTKALDDIAALKNEKPAPPLEKKSSVETSKKTLLVPTAAAPTAPENVSTPKPPGRNSPTPFGTGLSEPGKDKSYFELTVKLVGSEEPPFVVEVPLTGNGVLDKGNAIAVARKKFPGRAMTIVTSRIYTKTANALSEIPPGSTLSMLFGTPGGITEDLIEVGRAFYDGSRGTVFLRNLRTHVGVTFRPASGGLAVFSNRIVSNRLASELPLIVAEILGNNAREIEIYLKA